MPGADGWLRIGAGGQVADVGDVAVRVDQPGDDGRAMSRTTRAPVAIGLAVHDVLHALARQGSVLVAIDDVQWLDPATRVTLEIAVRRLREDPIGLLVTTRRAKDVAVPLGLERSLSDDRLTVLPVGPLSLGAVHRLLNDRLGLELSRSMLARVREGCGGNPYFALELGRELRRAEGRTGDRGLRVPESLRELLGGRLAQLPADVADVLLEVAALARPTVELVAAADGDLSRVRNAISLAVAEEVVELDDSRVRFAHPLLASICYERAPIWKRRAIHRALAAVVVDLEERARHLALAAEGPDPSVALVLEAAAGSAATRGATAAAAELFELAGQLTAADPDQARQRRLRAAGFHRLAGDLGRGRALLDDLLGEASPGAERADVLFELAAAWTSDIPTQVELYEQARTDVEGDDTRSARWLAFRGWVRLLESDTVNALVDARAALEKAERVGDPALLATVIARLGQIEMWAGEVTAGLLERGAEIEQHEGLALDYMTSPRFWLARFRIRQGELTEARAMLSAMESETAARGDEQTRVLVVWYRSLVEWFGGNWQRALELASEAYEVGEQTQCPNNRGWKGRLKALIEADLGLVEQARASANEGVAEMAAVGNEMFTILSLAVVGRLELALGNFREAGRYLAELPSRLLSSGLNDPTQPVWADAIETLIALGEREQARGYLDAYERNSVRTGSAWAVAAATRCRGLLAAAEGDLPGAFDRFDRALVQLDEQPFPFERARTLLCLGCVRRQALQKKAARQVLEQAHEIFDELGAQLWATKARAELARISGRRASGDALTETEARVAALAASGRSNKEIAAELFMGVSTVEAHLSHVYRKLGIRSRAGLGTWAAAGTDGYAKPVGDARQS